MKQDMTAQEAAKYIIREYRKQNPETQGIELEKLQALLYYAQGYSLGLTGKPIFSDAIEASEYEPVVKSVYQEYEKYNGGLIPYEVLADGNDI